MPSSNSPPVVVLVLISLYLAMNMLRSVELCGSIFLVSGGDGGTVTKAKQSGLPRRMITVFGLESSGTAYVYHTLGKALNLTRVKGEEYTDNPQSAGNLRIQYLSLPLGEVSEDHPNYSQRYETLPIVPVKPLSRCVPSQEDNGSSYTKVSNDCKVFSNFLAPPPSPRYFVNVTSHLEWYQHHGVKVQAVVVVRDPILHFQNENTAKTNETAAYEQYKQGVAILQTAMDHVPNVVVVSYETLMTLRGRYLQEIYQSLGIESDFLPPFRNGNAKYVNSLPPSVRQKLMDEKR